jgi:alkanesulfonate monooxygenase SsuD/methylene tetrahydromethanopterin reductase-like flavin-dependent oxidoreductase (luciferase family)
MKFSLIFEAQMTDTTPANERRVLEQCVEQAVYAEEMGFDRIWAVEHHGLKWYAHISAPEVLLTWIAAKTKAIRVGHGVVCMPFGYNHPLRAAERAAMLDVLSGGRLDLGAGRGATRQEMLMMGVDPDDTYAEVEESLRIIGHCWRQEEFEWNGERLQVPPRPVLPRPVQLPHPPLYLACTKRDTVALAAEYGVGALVLGFAGADEVRELRKIYADAIATRSGERLVSPDVNDWFSALCPTIVLDDGEEALRVGVRGQRFFAEAISHYYGGGPPPDLSPHSDDELQAIRDRGDAFVAMLHEAKIPVTPSTTGIYNPEHAYGTYPQAIDYVDQLLDAGADEIMCLMQMGTVPHEACMETIRQWGEKVIPHFRNGSETNS